LQRLFRKKAFSQRVWKNARSFFLHQPMYGGGEAESLRQGADKSIKNKTAVVSAVLFFEFIELMLAIVEKHSLLLQKILVESLQFTGL
jgi:hypothetical protein